MAYGVTPTGYLRKDLATIISELETAWKGIYGDNLNVSAASSAGQIIGTTAAMISDAWEENQNTFDAYNPDAAAGVALSNLVQINRIERRLASASTVLLTLTMSGSGTLTVPAGSIVSDSNGIQWTTDSNASRSGSGTITGVAATCTETGPITYSATAATLLSFPTRGSKAYSIRRSMASPEPQTSSAISAPASSASSSTCAEARDGPAAPLRAPRLVSSPCLSAHLRWVEGGKGGRG